MATTKDCAGSLNREHYISQVVLKEIGEIVRVGGMPWILDGNTKDLKTSQLVALVLCERHNSSLSPLDTHAGKFMRTLKSIDQDFAHVELQPDAVPSAFDYLLSGEMLERWMLKVLLGLYFSKNVVVDGQPALNQFPIDMERALKALYEGAWGNRCGLYVACVPDEELQTSLRFEARVLCGLSKNMAYGVRIVMFGLEFYLVLDDLDGNILINDEATIFRPSHIDFVYGSLQRRIVLSWEHPQTQDSRGIAVVRTTS